MKKFKLHFKGGPKEIEFLEAQKAQGYVLKSIEKGVYTFEENPEVKHTKLQVNFIKTNDLQTKDTTHKHNPYLAVITKRLNYAKYTIIYSYLKETDNQLYNIVDTKVVEHTYLSHYKNLFSVLATLAMIICTVLWVYFTRLSLPHKVAALPMLTMITVFIIYFVVNMLINRRIDLTCPMLEDEFYLSYSVSIKYVGKQPNIDDLKYLGAWRYQTESNNKYYYNLHSKQSKETITHAISSQLNIPESDIYVYSQLDLFPIRLTF